MNRVVGHKHGWHRWKCELANGPALVQIQMLIITTMAAKARQTATGHRLSLVQYMGGKPGELRVG